MTDWTVDATMTWLHERGYVWEDNLLQKFQAWVRLPGKRADRWVGDFDAIEAAMERVENYKAL